MNDGMKGETCGTVLADSIHVFLCFRFPPKKKILSRAAEFTNHFSPLFLPDTPDIRSFIHSFLLLYFSDDDITKK